MSRQACEPLSGIVDPMICDMIFHFVPLLGLSRAELLIERPWYWDRIVVAYKILRLVNKQWAEYLKKFIFASIYFGRPLRRYQGIVFDWPRSSWQRHVLHLTLDYYGRDRDLQNAQGMCVGEMLELRTLKLMGPRLRVEVALSKIPFGDLEKLHSVIIVILGTKLDCGPLGLALGLKKLKVTFDFCESISRGQVDGMIAGLPVGNLNSLSITDYNFAVDGRGRMVDRGVNSVLKGVHTLNGASRLTGLLLREIRVWEPFLLLMEALPALASLTVYLDTTSRMGPLADMRASAMPMLNSLTAPFPLVKKLLGDRPIRSLEILPRSYSLNAPRQSDLVDILPSGLTSLAYTAASGDLEATFESALRKCRFLKQVHLDLVHCIGNEQAQELWVQSLFKGVTKYRVDLKSIRLFRMSEANIVEVGVLNRETWKELTEGSPDQKRFDFYAARVKRITVSANEYQVSLLRDCGWLRLPNLTCLHWDWCPGWGAFGGDPERVEQADTQLAVDGLSKLLTEGLLRLEIDSAPTSIPGAFTELFELLPDKCPFLEVVKYSSSNCGRIFRSLARLPRLRAVWLSSVPPFQGGAGVPVGFPPILSVRLECLSIDAPRFLRTISATEGLTSLTVTVCSKPNGASIPTQLASLAGLSNLTRLWILFGHTSAGSELLIPLLTLKCIRELRVIGHRGSFRPSPCTPMDVSTMVRSWPFLTSLIISHPSLTINLHAIAGFAACASLGELRLQVNPPEGGLDLDLDPEWQSTSRLVIIDLDGIGHMYYDDRLKLARYLCTIFPCIRPTVRPEIQRFWTTSSCPVPRDQDLQYALYEHIYSSYFPQPGGWGYLHYEMLPAYEDPEERSYRESDAFGDWFDVVAKVVKFCCRTCNRKVCLPKRTRARKTDHFARVVKQIGPHLFRGISSNNTGNTTVARELLALIFRGSLSSPILQVVIASACSAKIVARYHTSAQIFDERLPSSKTTFATEHLTRRQKVLGIKPGLKSKDSIRYDVPLWAVIAQLQSGDQGALFRENCARESLNTNLMSITVKKEIRKAVNSRVNQMINEAPCGVYLIGFILDPHYRGTNTPLGPEPTHRPSSLAQPGAEIRLNSSPKR
ncbi:hypothetical protein JAAARDRAFT_43191 [Jaapia argillacea MUCL 33604]|uniref:Uncharacterized protein n=1 Tax=Jaapia argillacea MUCL 33604 TaxID=933084 RepID=A0A067QA11_9AGAM|nr:hypothetical protein JAAARDRAFT_43191 [Jaapia argillacea MUCL 33604]